MNKTISNLCGLVLVLGLTFLGTGCDKIQTMIKGDRLYFCEEYLPSKDMCEGESLKFQPGDITVLAKLRSAVGETEVNINISEKSSGNVVNTIKFNVESNNDYIYFENIKFGAPGIYKVSLLKNDGTVIATNEIEIIDKQVAIKQQMN